MDIITISFEEPLLLTISGEVVQIIIFATAERGNIKFGIQAARSIQVHREEIFQAIKVSCHNRQVNPLPDVLPLDVSG